VEQKVLITGFNGELGRKIVKKLVEHNKKVIAIDINDSQEKINSVTYIKDTILNYDLINSIFKKNYISEVYHFAALLSQTASKNPKLAIQVNEDASRNLIDCAFQNAVDNNYITKFFFPSSIAVYGPRKIKFASEQDIIKPNTIYGNNKLAIEQYGSRVHEKSNLKVCGLDFRSIRFPGVISYDTVPSGGTTDYASQMIHAALKGHHFDCNLLPETSLPFISINKTISSIMKLMSFKNINSIIRAFNVEEVNFSVKELSDMLIQKFPTFTVSFNEEKKFQSVADTWPSSLNCDNSKKYWKFSSNIQLEEFLDNIIDKAK